MSRDGSSEKLAIGLYTFVEGINVDDVEFGSMGMAESGAGDVSHTYKRNRREVSEGRWNSSVLKRSKRDSIRIRWDRLI